MTPEQAMSLLGTTATICLCVITITGTASLVVTAWRMFK